MPPHQGSESVPAHTLSFGGAHPEPDLGAVASLGDAAYLSDATFLRGSAAALTHPVLVTVLMAGVAGLAWIGFGAAPQLPVDR